MLPNLFPTRRTVGDSFKCNMLSWTTIGYLNETKRLYGVLEGHLKDREYLAGPDKGKFSVADIKTSPWIGIHTRVGIELDEFPNLKAYLERCKAREGSQAGYKVAA